MRTRQKLSTFLFMAQEVSGNIEIPENQSESKSNTVETNFSLSALFDLFAKYKLHGLCNAQETIKGYRQNFELLLQFNPNLLVNDLDEKTIVNFLEFLNTRKRKVGKQQIVRTYKNSSIAVVRSRLNAFFNWLTERNYIEVNPFSKIPYPKVSYTDRRAFSPKEFEAICYAVNTKIRWANLLIKKRNIAIVMFLALTGVRKEELLGLRVYDVELERKLITIRAETSKSKRTRLIPMNVTLIPYLEDYLNYRSSFTSLNFWISGTTNHSFTEHGTKHLINLLNKTTKINCHLHRFRHTFAINYYSQSHDIVGLKKLMGHQSLKMTLSYLRSLPDEHVVEQIQKMTVDEFV